MMANQKKKSMSKSRSVSTAARSHIQLSPKHERAIEEAIKNGLVRSVDEFIETALATVRQPKNQSSTPEAIPRPRLSIEEWAQQFEEWANSFPDAPPIPDEALSRKNLYPDRW